jgi:hypothetical protein
MNTPTRILMSIAVLAALVRPASGIAATPFEVTVPEAITNESATAQWATTFHQTVAQVPSTPAESESHLGEPPVPAVSLEPTVTVLGSPAQRVAVEDSLATFASLGMALPNFTARFHDTETGCDDHLGLFDFTLDPWTLEICSDLTFVIPHEIGHAWERANLTAEDRAIYMQARGIAEWQNLSLPTDEQGIEDIAFTIQKAILQGPDINENVATTINLLWDLAAT